MRTKQLACFGDSLTGGYFAAYAENIYQNVLLDQLRGGGRSHSWNLLTPGSSACYPRLGQIWLEYRKYTSLQPDLVVFQGGENDSSSAVPNLAASASCSSNTLVFNANITAGRAYIITDGVDEEVVIPQSASTVTGTRVIRGAMGTKPRDWAVGSTVRTWDQSTAAGLSAFLSTYEYALRDILATTGDRTIVLVGSLWFGSPTDLNVVALKSLVDGLSAENPRIEFVPYETADGASLTDPSGGYVGPTTRLDADCAADATTATVQSTADIEVGDLLLLTTQAGSGGLAAPTTADSEIVQVAAKDDAANTITFDTTATNTGAGAQRNKLGSTNMAFGANNRVCKVAHGTINPRAAWLTLGAADFGPLACQYDHHPNDSGQRELGYAFYRGYQRALDRIGGA